MYKNVLGCNQCYSVALMLSELNLPDFGSLYANCVLRHYASCLNSGNVTSLFY